MAFEERQRAEEAAAAETARRMMHQQQQHAEEPVAVHSYESEVDGPTGRAGENSVAPSKDKANSQSPRRNQNLTRREIMSARRDRARNRHYRPTATSPIKSARPATSSPTKSVPPTRAMAAPQPEPAARVFAPPKEDPKQEAKVHKPSSSANANARASARDRYARHKRMLQQRNNS